MQIAGLFVGDRVADCDGGVDVGGDVIDEVGFVAPLLDGVDRALMKDFEATDRLDLLHFASLRDDGVEGDLSLNVRRFGYGRVDRGGR